MLVCLPVHHTDILLALRNVEWAQRLDSRKVDYDCLVVAEEGVDVEALLLACDAYFRTVTPLSLSPWTGDQRRPVPQNYMWQCTARHIEALPPKERQPWLWWEPDAVPVQRGWLDAIVEAHTHGARPISACVAHQHSTGHYPAGVAVWPANPSAVVPTAMRARSSCFDIVSAQMDGSLRFTHDISALIHHSVSSNTHFRDRSEAERVIPPTAVLFHKCKDGSLIDVLEGRSPADAPIGVRSWPSIHDQAVSRGWQSGLFAFPRTDGTVHFNPSLVRTSDSTLRLITRRSRRIDRGSTSDLALWDIREPGMTLRLPATIPTLPIRERGEQWEDPKALLVDGRLVVACANWIHFSKHPIRQVLLQFDDKLQSASIYAEPVFGGQAVARSAGTRHEKNWCPFIAGGKLRLVYSINPHVTFALDGSDTTTAPELPIEWPCGEPRGGTPPVRVGGEFISFFHSALPWQRPLRRYFIGAYAFTAAPPHSITRITALPILAGSEDDARVLGGPLCVFPNGALYERDAWTIVLGLNDEDCAWLRLPHSDLERLMVPVNL